MPTDPALRNIGPEDPDASEGFGQVGAGTTAKTLLRVHADMFPAEMVGILSGPKIELATDVAADHLDAIAEEAGVDEIEGANVRGDEKKKKTWMIDFIYIVESGRSVRGVIPYADVDGLDDDYEQRKDLRVRAGVLRAVSDSGTAPADSPNAGLVKEFEEMREELDALRDPEPFEDYRDANAPDVVARLKSLDPANPRDFVLAEDIEDYERRHDNRVSVIEAAQKARVAPDPPAGDGS